MNLSHIPILQAMRPGRWGKSLIIIPVLLVSHQLKLTNSNLVALLFICLCLILISSASYIVNEFFDSKADQHHPHKSNRPLINSSISRLSILGSAFFLAVISLALCSLFFPQAFAMLIAFILCGLAYNIPPLRLKNIPYVDILIESLNAPIRLNFGWSALFGDYCPWEIGLSFFAINVSLMALKRYFEMSFLLTNGLATRYRVVYSHYTKTILLSIFLLALAAANYAACYSQNLFPYIFLVSLLIMAMFWKGGRKSATTWINLEQIYTSLYFWLALNLLIIYILLTKIQD